MAQANVGQATLTSPLAGTVAAVAISAGQAVSASSTSETITVIGPGNYQVSTTAALSIVDKIKVGQPATVAVDGGSGPLTGTVAVIGALKSSTSISTNPVYPVLITLDQTDATLFNGAGASVSITVGKVDSVLTVPSSAIKTLGSQSTVQVLTNGVPTTSVVTVGAIGNDLTQILSGVTVGQQVVIADLSAALPTTTTASVGVVGGLGGAGGGGAVVGGPGAGGAGARGRTGAGGFVRSGG